MSFTYKELKRQVRFKAQDNNEISYSDYDIKMATNEVLSYLSNSYALMNADFMEVEKVFSEPMMNEEVAKQNDEILADAELSGSTASVELLPLYNFRELGVDLPEDFTSLVAVLRMRDGYLMQPCEGVKRPLDYQYKVVGGKIYSGTPVFSLMYRASLVPVKDEKDEINLPPMWMYAVAKLVHMVLAQAENDVLLQTVNDTVESLVPRRRYRNARINMQFKIGGR